MQEDVDMGEYAEDERVEPTACELPSLVSVHSMFREAQQTAFNCNLPDASAHLHRAPNIFRDAIRAQNHSGTRQVLLTEMLRRDPSPMEE